MPQQSATFNLAAEVLQGRVARGKRIMQGRSCDSTPKSPSPHFELSSAMLTCHAGG
jgi:hypothetical protein